MLHHQPHSEPFELRLPLVHRPLQISHQRRGGQFELKFVARQVLHAQMRRSDDACNFSRKTLLFPHASATWDIHAAGARTILTGSAFAC